MGKYTEWATAKRAELDAQLAEKSALANRLAGIKRAADALGDGPTLTKLLAFLSDVRELLEQNAK